MESRDLDDPQHPIALGMYSQNSLSVKTKLNTAHREQDNS